MLLFGETLKTLRQQKKLTMSQMAALLNINYMGYRNTEANVTPMRTDRLFQIAEIFHMDATEIINQARYGHEYITPKQQQQSDHVKYLQLQTERYDEIYHLQQKIIELQEKIPFKKKQDLTAA